MMISCEEKQKQEGNLMVYPSLIMMVFDVGDDDDNGDYHDDDDSRPGKVT